MSRSTADMLTAASLVAFVAIVVAAFLSPWVVYGDPRCIVAQCRIEVTP